MSRTKSVLILIAAAVFCFLLTSCAKEYEETTVEYYDTLGPQNVGSR